MDRITPPGGGTGSEWVEAGMTISPEHHAAFLESLGHTVRRVKDQFWFNTARGVYSSFPYHHDLDAASVDPARVLGRDGLMMRYGCPLGQGVESYRIICDDRDYDFPNLRSRTRTQTRRALEKCSVEPVGFDDLKRHALPLNADTLKRQQRTIPDNLDEQWLTYYAAAEATPGAETWACLVDGEMAAYLIAFVIEDVANLLIVRSSLKHLDACPNNALLFRYLHTRMRQGDVRCVSYGYQSIQSRLGSLDQFKTGIGFTKQPVGQRVELAGWLRPFAGRLGLSLAKAAVSRLADDEHAAKFSGMLDWYATQPKLGGTTSVESHELQISGKDHTVAAGRTRAS